jgi:hypothetical protein
MFITGMELCSQLSHQSGQRGCLCWHKKSSEQWLMEAAGYQVEVVRVAGARLKLQQVRWQQESAVVLL